MIDRSTYNSTSIIPNELNAYPTSIIIDEETDSVAFDQPDEMAVGTVRCRPRRVYTMEYQIAILRTNWQIYSEASSIFYLENFWVIVHINKAGFGQEMKDNGFPVVLAGNLWRCVKFPAMKVLVTFPSLNDQIQSDVLVVPTIHLEELMRALWTAKGASDMEVTVRVRPPLTNKSPKKGDLLRPFLQLRSIKRFVIWPASGHEYMNELTRAVTTTETDGINQSFRELTAGLKILQRSIKTKQWRAAVPQVEKHLMLMIDCQIVYGERFNGIEPSLEEDLAVARAWASHDINIASAMSLAEVNYHMHKYSSTISDADRALDLMSRISIFKYVAPTNPTDAFPPCPQIFCSTGIFTSHKKTKCHLLLIRAWGYLGLQQANDALHDIEKVRRLKPKGKRLRRKLAVVSKAWQAMFNPSAPALLTTS